MPLDAQQKPQGSITVFSDYACPFCYIGSRRVERLREVVDLAVDWRFIEIRPGIGPAGLPLSRLGYAPEVWQQLQANLARLARQEGIALGERSIAIDSRLASLTAEFTLRHLPERFAGLHEHLFAAHFCAGRNIGDPAELRRVAGEAGLDEPFVERAWRDAAAAERLAENRDFAVRIGISGTPAFLIGQHVLEGAVPLAMLAEHLVEIQAPS